MSTIHVDAAGDAFEHHAIVPSVSIENMLRQRDAVLDRIERAVDLLTEACELAASTHLGFPAVKVARGGGYDDPLVGANARRDEVMAVFQRSLDAEGWRYLLGESGMRSFMSASKRAEFEKQLAGGTVPELTMAAVRSTFGALHQARGDMLEEGVIECFKHLSWHYKTNSPVKFGKRIIVNYLVTLYRPTEKSDWLDDLMRVFYVVDGRPEPDHRHGTYYLIQEAKRAGGGTPYVATNDYLEIRVFKNGNGHVTFKRDDLVEALNRIIARHFPGALPAPR